jgi:hypothetical protein
MSNPQDAKGGMSIVTQANVFQSNGVIHLVDTVVLPQSLCLAAKVPAPPHLRSFV